MPENTQTESSSGEPAAASESAAAGGGGAKASAAPKAPEERTVIDAAADLLQTVVDFLRQEVDRVMRDKIVLPLQRLGFTLFAASAAASLMALGLAFISVGSFMHLGNWIGYPNALLLIGGLLAVGSAIFLSIKMRLMQK